MPHHILKFSYNYLDFSLLAYFAAFWYFTFFTLFTLTQNDARGQFLFLLLLFSFTLMEDDQYCNTGNRYLNKYDT